MTACAGLFAATTSGAMLSDAFKALAQMFTPPFRTVLLKSVGLAILLLILLGIGLHRLLAWLSVQGAAYLEGFSGPGLHTPLHVLLWIVTVALGFGLFAGAIFIMPAVSAFTASFFSDEIAAEVEHVHYPADPPGTAGAGLDRRHRRHQDRAAGAAGLSPGGAVPAVRGARLSDFLCRERLSARARVFPARRDALSFGRGRQAAAQACTTAP